jgi:hypothetical protein
MIYSCLGLKEGGNRDPIDTRNNIQCIDGSPYTMIHLIGSGCDQNSHPYYPTLLPFLKLIKKQDVNFLRNSKGEVLKVHKIPNHADC